MFDVHEHAYQADGTPLPVEAAPKEDCTTGTQTLALAVWVSVPPSKAAAAVLDHNTVVVALWAWQQEHPQQQQQQQQQQEQQQQDTQPQCKNKLVYATFVDSLPQMPLLRGWIQLYQPSALYWACQEHPQQHTKTTGNAPNKKQKTKPQVNIWESVAAFMQALSENTQDTSNAGTTDAAAAAAAAAPAPYQTLSVTGYPTHLFTDAHRTMPALLQELVQHNQAAQFALKANRDLSLNEGGGGNNSSNSSSSSSSKNKLWSALALLWHGRGGGSGSTSSSAASTTWTGHDDPTAAHNAYDILPAARAPFVVIDRAAATSLNIWPIVHQGQAAAQGATTYKDSIYGLLSHPCHTPGGKQLLKQWLQQPLTDLSELQDRQDAVAHLVQCSVERTALRSVGLAPLQLDLGQLATKLKRYNDYFSHGDNNNNTSGDDDDVSAFGSTRKALQTLYEVYMVASQKVPALLEQVLQVASVLPPPEENNRHRNNHVLWKTWSAVLPQLANELRRSVALVEAVLDLNLAPREYLVQATFHPDLQELQDELHTVQADVDDEHAAMNDTWAETSGRDTSQVRLEFDNSDNTWQFRLPQTNDSKILQDQLKHCVQVHRVLKNGVHFSTKRLRQLSEKRRSLLAQYDRLQRQVTIDALQVGATYHAVIGRLARVVAHMDAIAALADVSGTGYNVGFWHCSFCHLLERVTQLHCFSLEFFCIAFCIRSLQQLLSSRIDRQ
jgi:hypothetical protein